MSTSESWFLEYSTSGDIFSRKICVYLRPSPPAQFQALANVKPAHLSHSTLGSEQGQAWDKNVHNTFTSAIPRGTSFSWCIVRKYISGNWSFIFISITFMLWKRLIFIRRGEEVRFEAGAPWKILPLHPPSLPWLSHSCHQSVFHLCFHPLLAVCHFWRKILSVSTFGHLFHCRGEGNNTGFHLGLIMPPIYWC